MIDISFFLLDGQMIATRRWHAVPRKGDQVMLGSRFKDPFIVERVTWGTEGPDPSDFQAVYIEVVRA